MLLRILVSKVYLAWNAIICFQILSQYLRLRKESSKSLENTKIPNRHPVLLGSERNERLDCILLYLVKGVYCLSGKYGYDTI